MHGKMLVNYVLHNNISYEIIVLVTIRRTRHCTYVGSEMYTKIFQYW